MKIRAGDASRTTLTFSGNGGNSATTRGDDTVLIRADGGADGVGSTAEAAATFATLGASATRTRLSPPLRLASSATWMLSSFMILTRTRGRAAGLETEKLRGAARYIDNAAARKRAAVVDAQLQRAAVIEIGHLDDARHRQGVMCRGQLVQIEDLAIGGVLPVELLAIPRGHPGLVVIVVDRRIVPDPIDLVRSTDLVHRPPGAILALIAALLRTAAGQHENHHDCRPQWAGCSPRHRAAPTHLRGLPPGHAIGKISD